MTNLGHDRFQYVHNKQNWLLTIKCDLDFEFRRVKIPRYASLMPTLMPPPQVVWDFETQQWFMKDIVSRGTRQTMYYRWDLRGTFLKNSRLSRPTILTPSSSSTRWTAESKWNLDTVVKDHNWIRCWLAGLILFLVHTIFTVVSDMFAIHIYFPILLFQNWQCYIFSLEMKCVFQQYNFYLKNC